MAFKIVLSILCCMWLAHLFGPGKEEVKQAILTIPQDRHDTIPFQLTEHNNIIVTAVLNETDTLRLMFHTAAGSVTLIRSVTDRLRSLTFNQLDTINSWGGENAARSSEHNTIAIGNTIRRDVRIWENENSGPLSDGKFGPDHFQGKVIEINYDQSCLVIHESLPAFTGKYQKLPLTYENGFLFVEGTLKLSGKQISNRFLIHSGYGGTVLLDDEFADTHQLGEQLEIIDTQELKDSYGNVVKVRKAILPRFRLGKMKLKQLPVGFFEGTVGRQKMSVLGGNMLKRFNLIIDVGSDHLYLKPSRFQALSFGS